MNLSEKHRDALMEIINIGFGQAARSLGLMVNRQVLLEAPYVEVIPITELENALSELADSSLLTVHQMFSGELSGDMMLLFEAKSAPKLVKLFNRGLTQKLTEEEHSKSVNVDELAELGNILLGAFAGAFGNLLHIQIRFAVPALHKVSLLSMLDSLKVGKEELRYAVVVRIFFRLVEDDIESRMLIVMGVASLEALLRAIESEGFLATSN